MPEKEYKWIVPELPPKVQRESVAYSEALEYLNEVKVSSRFDLRRKFSAYVIKRLLRDEGVGFLNLARGRALGGGRGGIKHRTTDLFNASQPFNTKLFIIYLKDEKEALIEYLASLIKPPLDKNKVKAISQKLRRLDDATRIKVIQRAGYNYRSKSYEKMLK